MFPLKVYLKLLCEKSHISGAFWGFFDKKTPRFLATFLPNTKQGLAKFYCKALAANGLCEQETPRLLTRR